MCLSVETFTYADLFYYFKFTNFTKTEISTNNEEGHEKIRSSYANVAAMFSDEAPI